MNNSRMIRLVGAKASWLLLLTAASTVAAAATSPIGRPLKFYESSPGKILRFHTPTSACTPLSYLTCFPLDQSGTGNFTEVELTSVAVSGSTGRSSVCVNTNATAIYAFYRRATAGTDISTFRLEHRYEIQSTVLDNPALINPRTGLPFNGKLALFPASVLTDQSYLGPLQRTVRTQKISDLDCVTPMLNYLLLVNTFGLSSTDAQRLLSGPMTVRLFVSGGLIATDGGSYTMQLRIMGD